MGHAVDDLSTFPKQLAQNACDEYARWNHRLRLLLRRMSPTVQILNEGDPSM